MCYISFAKVPLLKAFINQFNGYYFDDKAQRGDHGLRVVVSDTTLDAGLANRSRVLGGMRMDDDIEDCPADTREQALYAERSGSRSSGVLAGNWARLGDASAGASRRAVGRRVSVASVWA